MGRTVCFATNYSMRAVRDSVDRHELPAQHLWGSDALERVGYQVVHLDSPLRGTPGWLSRAARLSLGDLGAEARVRGDLAYAADHHTFRGLGLLRAFGRGPAVLQVVHHVPDDRVLPGLAVRGPDVVITLSTEVRDRLIERGRDASCTHALPWGPDLGFPGYTSKGDEFILGCGKANRDNVTLLRALQRVDFPARVYRYEDQAVESGPAVTHVSLGPRRSQARHLEYAEVLGDLRASAVIAISLSDPTRLAGLSELNDALALGKPVVMTRSPKIDVDIERIGCGVWVDPGDVQAWADALERLAAHPTLRREMGLRGREFAEREWNAALFGEGLVRGAQQAIQRRKGHTA